MVLTMIRKMYTMSGDVSLASALQDEPLIHGTLVLTPHMPRPKIRKEKNLLSGSKEGEESEEPVEVS